jgi:hypothetical protein
MADLFVQAFRAILTGLYQKSDSVKVAVYTPSGGEPVTLKVIIQKSTVLQPSGYDAEVLATVTSVKALLEDLGREPNRGDSLEIGDDTFTIKEVLLENNGRTARMTR